MKLAFSSNAFRRYSIEQTIGILAEIGYDGVELMCDSPHAWPPDVRPENVESIRRELRRTGLAISNLNAFMMCAYREPGTMREGTFHWPGWIDPAAHVRQARIAHTAACVELAAQLGAKTVSTEPGGPLAGRLREEGYRLFAEGLAPVARRAA